MPTFYFSLWDGRRLDPDEQGVELKGTEEAFEMAVKAARQMLGEAQLKRRIVPAGPSVCTTSKDGGCSPSGSRVRFLSPTTPVFGPDAARKFGTALGISLPPQRSINASSL
jgi:hypothetical protein